MTMQVVTNENIQQLISTGKVDPFVAPDAPAATDDKPRNPDGTFKPAAESVDTGEKKSDNADTDGAKPAEVKADDKPAADDSDDDEDLPEKVRKKIGAKHREMKEALEFAENEFGRRKAAERAAEELRQEIAAMKSKSGLPPDGKTESQDEGMPKQEDFKTVGEYADAVIEYKLNLRERANAEKAAKASAETEQQRLGAAFKKQETEVIAAHPDYRETVDKFDPTDMPGHMAQYLIESGPLLTYHVAKLPAQERHRIAQLSPIRAIAELGKLEANLEKPPQAEPAKQPEVSRAPSPIKPLSGDGAVPVNKDPAKMTFQELREYERAQSAEKRGRR